MRVRQYESDNQTQLRLLELFCSEPKLVVRFRRVFICQPKMQPSADSLTQSIHFFVPPFNDYYYYYYVWIMPLILDNCR
jgi:hypothetical protein